MDMHTPNSPAIPEFIDNFNPELARRAILAQLTALNSALAAVRQIDADLPMVSDLISTLETRVIERNTYLTDVLPDMLEFRHKLRELVSIDNRLSISPPKNGTSVVLFIALHEDESYHSFKFIAGKIVKLGWKLVEGTVDHNFGSVDFKFTCLDGRGKLTLYVKPGASQTCQVQEQTETREVVVKKLICDGVEAGELADVRLANPSNPQPLSAS